MNSKDYPKEYPREYQNYGKNADDRGYNQYQNNDSGGGSFLFGAIIGGLVGAATALFLAPKSGRELRSDLNNQARILNDKTEKIRQTAMEKGTELVEVAKSKTGTITDTVTKQASTITDTVTKQASTFMNKVNPNNMTEDMSAGDEGIVSETETVTISSNHNHQSGQPSDVAKLKLEEAKKAFEETENRYNQ
ncbi:YtxH domain-containing protein [Peribacillus alkalitolerans]|uniref:YtxH domain-containing protein n=1 Tax=Peribacillus alkalitolerans TaxID=1550385 RepID=UPI0013D76EB5|nr:YtxH domain-containing protein [Peribacillus alkalitolerans]